MAEIHLGMDFTDSYAYFYYWNWVERKKSCMNRSISERYSRVDTPMTKCVYGPTNTVTFERLDGGNDSGVGLLHVFASDKQGVERACERGLPVSSGAT